MTALVDYQWPGNVRELKHAIERAVILARTSALRAKDLPPEVRDNSASEDRRSELNLKSRELVMLREALRRFGGNRRRAAAALGISTVTLWRMMKRHGVAETAT